VQLSVFYTPTLSATIHSVTDRRTVDGQTEDSMMPIAYVSTKQYEQLKWISILYLI